MDLKNDAINWERPHFLRNETDDQVQNIETDGSTTIDGSSRKRIRLDTNDSIDSPSSSLGSESPISVQSPPTPMPHTPPVFSPPGSSSGVSSQSSGAASPDQATMMENVGGSPGQSTDISQDVLQNGWRRCWSNRERRWYFFNKLTQETRWEPPSTIAGASSTSSTDQLFQQQQSQQQTQPNQQTYRKFVPCDEWKLDIASNVRMPERVPISAFAPHPEMETLRFQATTRLRAYMKELCHAKDILDPYPDSINQWLMERKTLVDPFPCEQLLPVCPNADEISPAFYRNLLNCIPVRMNKVASVGDARKLMAKYAEAAKKIVDTRNVSPEHRKAVKWHCESMFEWSRKTLYASKLEEFIGRLSFLRSQCQPILTETMKPNVDFICIRCCNYSRELASSLAKEQRAKLEAAKVKIQEEPLPPARVDKIVPCYAIQLRWPCTSLPEIRMEQTADDMWVRVWYKEEMVHMRATHFYKLEQLYKHNCFDDRRFDCYLARIWCLMRRYKTMSNSLTEGVKLQQSVPATVFEYLHKTFDVTFECFASPFNCHFRQYCSVFADTDGYFGSRGSFFHFTPVAGSMQMNPPHVEEVMNASIDHAELLLENARGPMSFVIFLPDWREPLLQALVKAERSKFWRCQMTYPPLEHVYRHGFQHMNINSREIHLKSLQGTTVVILQNDAGNEMWPADEQKLTKMAEYFKQPMLLR